MISNMKLLWQRICFERSRSCLYSSNNFYLLQLFKKLRLVVILVAVTLPFISTSCERSFSKMKLVKKFPRSSMTSERLGNVDLNGVSRVWQAWHMPRAPLWRGRKNCLAKLKSLFTVLSPLFCAPSIHKLQSCINAASSPEALRWACCASTTKHYDKIALLWHNTRVRHCDRTRTLAMSTTPRPSHAIRKDKLVRTAAFQAKSECGWDEFKSVAVRIWVVCKYLLLRSYRFRNYLNSCGPLRLYGTPSMATSAR